MTKTFCPAPWTSLNIDQTGRVSCCMFGEEAIGNIKLQSIQEILKGTKLQEIKQSMMDGKWHPNCEQCRVNEQLTGASARTVRLVDSVGLEQINQNIHWFEPQHLVINWSNLCNLTCTYCNAETSTAWQSIKKIPINYVRNEHQDLIELAQQYGSSVQGLTLGGGEPLLQKGLVEFLKHLNSEQVRVLVTTNLSVDLKTNPVYQELRNWKTVEWQISFDNVIPEQFNYVRHGADWALFERNIDIMQQDGQLIKAHPAYSIYCAFDLPRYYEYCASRGLNIFWCYLDHPWDLDVRRLSLPMRAMAQEQIQLVVDQYSGQGDFALNTLKQYQQKLSDNSQLVSINTHPADPFKYSQQIEAELGKVSTFVELWPELAENLKRYHYNV